jgi:hypothetical protein
MMWTHVVTCCEEGEEGVGIFQQFLKHDPHVHVARATESRVKLFKVVHCAIVMIN